MHNYNRNYCTCCIIPCGYCLLSVPHVHFQRFCVSPRLYNSGFSISGSCKAALCFSAICWAVCCGTPYCCAACTGAVSAMPYAAFATNIKFAFVPVWLCSLLIAQFLQISNHFLAVMPCDEFILYTPFIQSVNVVRLIPTKKLNTSKVGNT